MSHCDVCGNRCIAAWDGEKYISDCCRASYKGENTLDEQRDILWARQRAAIDAEARRHIARHHGSGQARATGDGEYNLIDVMRRQDAETAREKAAQRRGWNGV